MGTTQLEAVQEPKYSHLRSVLSDALDSDFEVGAILPNERELAARFGVARATLRQALDQLELEGRLERRRGVGTTVAPPRMGVDVVPPPDEWRAVGCVEAAAPLSVAALLGTGTDEPVHTVRRVRSVAGRPVAVELLYVPGSSVPALSGNLLTVNHAPAVLRELSALKLDREDRSVELGSARPEDARQFDRLPGSAALVVTTRSVVAGSVVAVSVATYRADTCRLTFGAGGVEIVGDQEEQRRAS